MKYSVNIDVRRGLSKRVNLKDFNGFTLAEVLITLVIIGVIAAMTIPTLMNNTNKQEYVSKLKKAYSTMAQATNKIIADEGNPRADIGGWATSPEAVYNLYRKYLNKAKDCGLTSNKGCFSGNYKRMDNTFVSYEISSRYAFVLADGTEVLISEANSPNCTWSGTGTLNFCQAINVDINGAKGPNALGIDAFAFVLKENGLYPAGCDYEECNNTTFGWGCTCKVLREGAINY